MLLFIPIRIKMENAISSYSYTNNVISGYNEAMNMIDTTDPLIGSSLIPYDDTFCLYGNSSNDYSMFGVHHTMNYQSHCSNIFSEPTSILECPSQEETHLSSMHQPGNSISLQQSNNEVIIQNARKRTAEASDATYLMSSSSRQLTNTQSIEEVEDRRRLKRFQEKQPKIQREKGRRSQKLTHKITALQKLVSPYGKTDTASVLLEASISIKALQDKIKELFQLMTVQETANVIGTKGDNLNSRGLCLVPLVFLEELERQSLMHCFLQ